MKSISNAGITSLSTVCYTSKFTTELKLATLLITCDLVFFLLVYFYLEKSDFFALNYPKFSPLPEFLKQHMMLLSFTGTTEMKTFITEIN